jgi:hypothetical protein
MSADDHRSRPVKHNPRSIEQFAGKTGLGRVVDRHRMSVGLELAYLITFAGIGLTGLFVGDQVGRVIGAGALVLALIIGAVTWNKAHKVLYLCANGMLTTVRRTVITSWCTWDDVVHVWRWTTRLYSAGGSEYGFYDQVSRCTIEIADGRKLRLHRGPYLRIDEAAAYVERHVAPRIHSRRTAELAATGTTRFGPIELTTSGLRAGKRFAAWSDITRIEPRRVRLRIWTDTRRPTISRHVRTIPDLAVLMTMVADQRRQSDTATPDRHGGGFTRARQGPADPRRAQDPPSSRMRKGDR